MRFKTLQLLIGLSAAVELIGCAAAGKKPAEGDDSHAGWYMERAGQGMFQLCGQSQPLRVTVPADLPARAKAFGLDQDTPVYVRLVGSVNGDGIKVSHVEQFGSATPVRNCAMTGVVIPSPAPAEL